MNKRILFLGILCSLSVLGLQKMQAQDYENALRASIDFYDANRCGNDVSSDNVFDWRGACHTGDGSVVGLDLTGGFHDAGDHVKFGLPQTWSAATLGFALYEFRESFDRAGATSNMLSTLKHFTDFFLKCHINANTFYYNVGDGNADHSYWGSPELQTGDRPVIAATPSKPASDVCGEAAAALALMYLNYKNVDANYANQCLNSAVEIFNLGKNYLGRSDDGGGGNFYKSTSHFDDLTWGAVWLYTATGDNSYLSNVDAWIATPNDYGDDPYNKHWAPAWDDVTVYAMLKLAEITGEQKYYDGVINNLEWYRDDCQKTPYGLPWLDSWGVLRYASSEAGVGYLAAKKFEYAGYIATADLTMNYTLGQNPRNSSYITNWGNNAPQHPHHRANEPNRDGVTNSMRGALVGGPNNSDGYADDVNDYIMNEVAIDYNASFILGMAGKIYYEYNTPPSPNVPPTVSITSPSSGSSVDQGATISLSANASDSDGNVNLVEFLVGGSKVGEDATAPYSISWTVPLAGNYTISARAIDDRNGSTVSSGVNITAVSNIPDPTTPNLALNKTAVASSLENSGLPASNAVDGSYGSRWSSEFSDPQWIYVDLGASVSISRVILNWEAAAGKVYDIQVSDNASNWQTVAAITGGNGGEDDIIFAQVNARYVRMYGTERTTPYGYSIYEFEVYGGGVIENYPPTAVIAANPTNGYIPLAVAFSADQSSDSDGTIVSYSWNFGDGTSASSVSVSKTYQTAGTYQVTLTVTDNDGATSASTTNILASEPDQCTGNGAPTAAISITQASTEAPSTVTVDASGSSDPDGDTLAYSWTFGDGNSATGVDAVNTYTSAGTYNITLTVSDECSNSDSHQLSVTVESGGGSCDSPSIEDIPFSFDGSGEHCWFLSGNVAYVNSWNMGIVEINGVDYSNSWSNSMPPKIDGGYYVYYNGQYPWSHFEMAGTKSAPAMSSGQNKVVVYPNPFGSVAQLVLEDPEEVSIIKILDQTGKVVSTIEKSQISNLLTIGDQFVAGVYFVQIQTDVDIQTLIITKN